MSPINPDVPISALRLGTEPKEEDRQGYKARLKVLRDKILNHTATSAEVDEYHQIKNKIEILDQKALYKEAGTAIKQNNATAKKAVNNAWNQVRSAFSEFSNIFSPKTSDNAGEKEGEGIDE